MKSRLKKNIVYNVGGQISLLLLSFVAVKFIFSDLGEDALGLIYFVMTIISLLAYVLEIGITTTTTREVSAYFSTDPVYVTRLIRTASLFYWLIFIVIAAAAFAAAPLIVEEWIILTSTDKELAVHALRVLGVTSFLALPKSLYASLFRGIQRMEFISIIDVLVGALRQCGIIWLLHQEYGLLEISYWMALTYVLEILIYVGVLRKFFISVSFLPTYFHDVTERNIAFASKMMVTTMCGVVHRQLDKVILSKLLPIGVLGTYSLAQRGVSVGDLVSTAINSAAYPVFAGLQGEDQRSELMQQYRKLQDLMYAGNALILSSIPFAMVPVLTFIFNREVAQTLFIPVILLSLHAYFHCMKQIPASIAIAMGKPEIELKTLLYSLILVIPLSIIAIKRFGIIGAPLGLLVVDFAYFVYAIPKYCKLCLRVSLLEWYIHAFRFAGLAIAMYGTALFLIAHFDKFDIVSLMMAYCISTFVFVVGSFFFISPETRAIIINVVKPMLQKVMRVH